MRLSFNWFHLILLFPCLYFFYWIDNADRNSKIFPIIYYFYWIYISLLALFSMDMTIFHSYFSLLFCNMNQMLVLGVFGCF